MPLISIVMPVYGVEKYIAESVKTICNQIFKDFELILVDDGTKDRSIEYAEVELSKYDIDYTVIHQSNQGVSSARNIGIKKSLGEWVICVDPDDGIDVNTLSVLSQLIKRNPSINIWGINFRMVNSLESDSLEGQYKFDIFKREELIELFLLRKIKIITPGLLIKKQLVVESNLFYDSDVKFTEDLLYIWKILSFINEFGFVHNPFYQYLERPESTMTSSSIDKIKTGYNAFKKLDTQIKEKLINYGRWGEFIFPRWLLGTFKSSARHMSYKEFQKLTEEFDYKNNIKLLKKIPDWRTKFVAKLILYSRITFYYLAKNRVF